MSAKVCPLPVSPARTFLAAWIQKAQKPWDPSHHKSLPLKLSSMKRAKHLTPCSLVRKLTIILEDEKVYGTVHIAFGTNTSFGGTNKADCHMDGIILEPTLYFDDKLIIDKGKFVV